MKRESAGPILSTVFVDYDNIYLSLKRKSDEAAKRFAKDSGVWLQAILSGELITPTSAYAATAERRVVMNRCYGNPVPRRNSHDNSTDMNSFPFVRHHFLRSGFEVIDCPPLTAQLKNSADIRIVMDIRDILNHDTRFDEFIILSGDADFTPVLHRLRAHARRTVVFANDHTAQPYTAISDGEIRESSLISLLLNNRALNAETAPRALEAQQPAAQPIDLDAVRRAIVSEVVGYVRTAPQAVPMETLADRAVRVIGRDKTVGTNWGGYGTFRELLLAGLPEDIHLSDTPPYTVFDANRHITETGLITAQIAPPRASVPAMPPLPMDVPAPVQAQVQVPTRTVAANPISEMPAPQPSAMRAQPAMPPAPRQAPQPQQYAPQPAPQQRAFQPAQQPRLSQPLAPPAAQHAPELAPARSFEQGPFADFGLDETAGFQGAPSYAEPPVQRRPAQPAAHQAYQPPAPREATRAAQQVQAQVQAAVQQQPMMKAPVPQSPRTGEQATQIQQSIARIHDACQAPALAPAEYRVLFDVLAQEISSNGLQGAQTLINVTQRAREFGLDLRRDDLRFILDVVSESDPWFEQGASANLFASRFRNFVVARCRSQGLSLSADELDLIEAWFAAQPANAQRTPNYGRSSTTAAPQQQPAAQQMPAYAEEPLAATGTDGPSGERWWSLEEGRQHIAEQRGQGNFAAAGSDDEFPRIVRSRLRG